MHLKYLRHFSEAKRKKASQQTTLVGCLLTVHGANVHLNTHARHILHDSVKKTYSHSSNHLALELIRCAIGNCKRYFDLSTFVHLRLQMKF